MKQNNLYLALITILIVVIFYVSVSENVVNNSKVNKVLAWDAMIKLEKLKEFGFDVLDNLDSSISCADVILILNNHPDNVCSYLISNNEKDILVFDGWNQLDRLEIEKNPRHVYATMGYMTPSHHSISVQSLSP